MPEKPATVVHLPGSEAATLPYDAIADHVLQARRIAATLNDPFMVYLLDMVLTEIATHPDRQEARDDPVSLPSSKTGPAS